MQEDPHAEGNCDTERWKGMWNGVARGERSAGEGVERKPLGGMYGGRAQPHGEARGTAHMHSPSGRRACKQTVANRVSHKHANDHRVGGWVSTFPFAAVCRSAVRQHIVTVPDVYSTMWGQLAPIKCIVSCKPTGTVG